MSVSFDTHVRASLERMLTGIREPLEAELRAYAEQLDRIAARAAKDAAAAGAAEAHREGERRLAALRESGAREIQSARAAAEAGRRSAEAQVEEARRAARAQVEDVRRELGDRLTRAQGEIEDLQRELEASRRARTAIEEAAAASARDLDDARARARMQIDALQRAGAAAEEHLRLAFHALEHAGTLSDVLDALAQHAAPMAERAGVFVVKDSTLRERLLVGFAAARPPGREIELPIAEAGLMGRAVQEGEAVVRLEHTEGAGEPAEARPAFAATGDVRHAAAWPLVVGSRTVAVLYADRPAAGVAAGWPAGIGLLARYASLVLEARTVQYAAGLRQVRPTASAVRSASSHS